ncbi:hypothetical protein JCM21714_4013 [Gracilibacillus boraciitolerans JCM 21714]|uniref:Uncharacterized protein n=1 Tax=Gracilibacillus boraciitolerans JCM 21714 TaxID=1298598 RepID=W4VPY3_9BACI|nr:hypothetical protein [Gracilibacillus boraciitolerans]GAE94819.1 hypothetical protein JCM21714_4013 [Gracilibacillus boraciitolerans JCM 21714]
MIKNLKNLGWKKLLIYSISIVIVFIVLGFTIMFGTLLLLDQFDNRYQDPETYGMDN